jgi:hypothetical protein
MFSSAPVIKHLQFVIFTSCATQITDLFYPLVTITPQKNSDSYKQSPISETLQVVSTVVQNKVAPLFLMTARFVSETFQ